MSRLIKTILIFVAMGFAWIIAELIRAPEGYEDQKGFHQK
jgi:hypothetical protein